MEQLLIKLSAYDDIQLKKFYEKTSIKNLQKIKDYCDNQYYNGLSENILHDHQYDELKRYLREKDPDYKNTSGYPIGYEKKDVYNIPVNLEYYLGSVDCFSNEEEKNIKRWVSKFGHSTRFIITEKLDGVSGFLDVKGGKYLLTTKGDGKVGCDISHIIPYIRGIPKNLKDISVRGELIMKKSNFSKHAGTYKTARNMVAGIIKKEKQELEDIDFVVYEIIGDGIIQKQETQLKELVKSGFAVVKHEVVDRGNINTETLEEKLTYFKSTSIYEIDGIIVNINDQYERCVDKDPDYMFAFKTTNTESVETVIRDIEWSISKWGQLIPIIIVDEISIGRVSISRVSGNNAKNIIDNKLGIGALIRVVRSKDVIPFISEIVQCSDKIKYPEYDYILDDNNTHFVIKELSYDVLVVIKSKYIASFFDKLGIKFVSEMSCLKLINNGYDNLLKILTMKPSDIQHIEGLGEKSADRIVDNIHKGLKGVSIPVLLSAAGVFGYSIGSKRLETLFRNVPDLLIKNTGLGDDIVDGNLKERILAIEGFSEITTKKILDNIDIAREFINMIDKFVVYKTHTRTDTGTMIGMKFVFTGSRNKELERIIADKGGSVESTVSKKITALIATNITSSSKIDKANQYNIYIYNVENFCKKYKIIL